MTRDPAEARLSNAARVLTRELRRVEAAEEAAHTRAEEIRHDLEGLYRRTAERFDGVPVPRDALLLDVLASVDVDDAGILDVRECAWRWRGMRNNKGLPVLKADRREVSAVRWLAVAFGVIEEDAWGTLHPSDGDVEDVNPWHRTLRPSPVPMGNAGRYGWTPPTPS